jgi:DNA-binding beta-propeller fold protein YncE
MSGHLEIQQVIQVQQPANAVALSEDAQYVIGALEGNTVVFSVAGRCLLSYPSSITPMPALRLAASSDLRQLYVVARQGWLIRLNLQREPDSFRYDAHTLYTAENDLHSLALSRDGQLLAVGHLGPALTVLNIDGRIIWRRHPQDGTATEGQVWTVAFDALGKMLYAGSAEFGTNRLAAIDTRSGTVQNYTYVTGQVTALGILPEGKGVAAVLAGGRYTGRLVMYNLALESLGEACFDGPITALAVDRRLLFMAVAIGHEGQIALIDAQNGEVLATTDEIRSRINGLAIAQGRLLAAATQDGALVLLRYIGGGFRL